jgi:hypothetical protein
MSDQGAFGSRPDIKPAANGAEVDCLGCDHTFLLRVEEWRIWAWLNGAEIEEAMPDLGKAERALLMMGYCGECFEKGFLTDEENPVQ